MTQRMFRYREAAVGLCLSLMLSACNEMPKRTARIPQPAAIEVGREPQVAKEPATPQPQVAEEPATPVRPKPPIPTAPARKFADYTVADSSAWYAKKLLALFPPDAIPIYGMTFAADELLCIPTDLASFKASASTTDIGLGSAFAVRGSVSLRRLPPPFRVFDGAMGKRYMLHLQAYLIAPSGRVVWSQKGFPQGEAWVKAEGAQANFLLINAYSGPTADHTVLILAAGDPVFSDFPETQVLLAANRVLLGADELKVQSKSERKPRQALLPWRRAKPKPLQSISLSSPVLVDFAYKLAVIDNGGYLPKGSSQELAIRRQIRDVYPKVEDSIEQIADATVVGVRLLKKKGIKSSNYKILYAINLTLSSETRSLWPMQYGDLVAVLVTITEDG